MKKLTVLLFFWIGLQLNAHAQSVELVDFNRLFDFAEANFPDLLAPGATTGQTVAAGSSWYFRDYGYLTSIPGGTGVMVAVNVSGGGGFAAGDVYAIGGAIGADVVRIDSLANLLTMVPNPGEGKLLIKAWDTEGVEMGPTEFSDYTNYRSSNWVQTDNQAVFPIGSLPAKAQSGSVVYQQNTANAPQITFNVPAGDYLVSDVPADTPLYFTALWRADNIGTVFMRADNEGQGITVDANGSYLIELPYDFALSEYQQLQRQLVGVTPSSEIQSSLDLVEQAMQSVNTAADSAAKALASYEALALIMPLKEQVVLEISNQAIATTGLRSDFDLNYEGFGSWTDTAYASNYQQAQNAGFESVYTHGQLMTLLTGPGEYDFSTLDSFVDQAEALGLKFGMAINTYTKGYPDWVQALSFEELKDLYYEIAFEVVSHFGDRVSWYYPVAEFEIEIGGKSMQQLTELAIASMAGARAAEPDLPMGYYASAAAYVSYQMNGFDAENPGFYSSLDLLTYMKSNGLELDFMALQMQYGTTFAPLDIQRFQEVIVGYHDKLQLPIYMGETGYSAKGEDYGTPADFYWHGGHTQNAQHDWADHTLRALYALPFVMGYYWVHLDPDNYDYGSDYLSSLIGTGLHDVDGNQRQALNAFSSFFSELSN